MSMLILSLLNLSVMTPVFQPLEIYRSQFAGIFRIHINISHILI
jgi:hypothetical protein